MADRVTTIRLRAEIADLKRQMAEAGVAVKGVGDEAEKASERSNAALGKLSNTAGMLGLAMVAAAVVAVKAFADFDQSMSYVQAATHESAANMDLLREASIEAGKRTIFSATEAAGAVEELAKAGIATADILAGGLNGALDLAAAGGLDVAEAAGIAAIALKQFNLAGDQMPHVADLMAAGAGKAMGSVSDLGMALRQAGQVANMTGLTIEETTAGLSAFASAGLLGSDAGTSFKAMLQRLTPQSAEAQAKMDELGISAYDAGGNFIGLADFAGNLQGALKDLSPEQRNAALAVIFGSDAVRAANVLYDEGAAGIEEWTAAVDDGGYAAETARTGELQDTLDGFGKTTDETLSTINDALSSDQNDWAEGLFGKDPESMIDQADKYGLSIEDLQGYILGEADAVDRVNGATGEYYRSHKRLNTVSTGIQAFTGALDDQAGALTGAEKAAAQKAAADEAAGVAQGDLADTYDVTTEAIAAQIPTLEDLVSLQAEAAGVVLSEREAQRAFQASLDDATAALEKNGQTLDIGTEAGRANQDALDAITDSTWKVIASMQANGATQAELQAIAMFTNESRDT